MPEDRTLGLAGLVAELSRIEGIERLRYTTSHPRDMTDDLIAAHAENPKLMPYLHLPVQSGSDPILKAMNRGHTAEQYLRLIEKIRAARPDIALSGDFIVGFPGETETDFESTLASGARGAAMPAPIRSSIRRAPEHPPPSMTARFRRRRSRHGSRPAGADPPPADGLQRRAGGPDRAGSAGKARPRPRPAGRPLALSAIRPPSGR